MAAPNYPNDYDPGTDCTATITLATPGALEIYFDDFATYTGDIVGVSFSVTSGQGKGVTWGPLALLGGLPEGEQLITLASSALEIYFVVESVDHDV